MKSLCDTCLEKKFCEWYEFKDMVKTEQFYPTGEKIITECSHYFNKD